MTYLIFSVLLWLWDNHSLVQISKNNRTRQEAFQAYQAGAYEQAAAGYQKLINASLFIEPSARLNLAHSHFRLNRLEEARTMYEQIADVNQADVAAFARTQLGVIACRQGDTLRALEHLRQALELRPDNETARYNYELIKKRFSGREALKPPARHPSPSLASAAQAPQETSTGTDREVERSEEKTELLRRLRALNLSEAQALQLLNAIQENEVLYIHQQKKASGKRTDNRYKQW